MKGYLRYMDDLLLFAEDKPTLHLWLAQIRASLATRLHLVLKEEATLLAPVSEGIPFLGLRVYPELIRLNQRSRRRFRRQIRGIERAYTLGLIDTPALCSRSASLFAHVAHADSHRLRRQVSGATMVAG